MGTMSTAGSPLSNRFFFTLVVVLFFAVQTTALSHEMQHVLHRHDAPCGLHIVADQLVMSAAPEPPLPLVLAPATDNVVILSEATTADPGRSHSARAPPLPA